MPSKDQLEKMRKEREAKQKEAMALVIKNRIKDNDPDDDRD